MNERIVIITGAAPIAPHVLAALPHEAILLAVDGGIDHALAAGLHPSGLIGDLDSVTPEGLAWASEHATIARHPADKDQTDTELALAFAADMDPERLTLVGGGDRLDHTFAGLGALGAPVLTSVPHVDAWWDGQHIDVVHGPGKATLRLVPGSMLSLLALHGRCTNVSIDAVRWPLDGVELGPLVGLGVSNVVAPPPPTEGGGDDPSDSADDPADHPVGTATDVTVTLSSGVLTVFDTPEPDPPPEETSP